MKFETTGQHQWRERERQRQRESREKENERLKKWAIMMCSKQITNIVGVMKYFQKDWCLNRCLRIQLLDEIWDIRQILISHLQEDRILITDRWCSWMSRRILLADQQKYTCTDMISILTFHEIKSGDGRGFWRYSWCINETAEQGVMIKPKCLH